MGAKVNSSFRCRDNRAQNLFRMWRRDVRPGSTLVFNRWDQISTKTTTRSSLFLRALQSFLNKNDEQSVLRLLLDTNVFLLFNQRPKALDEEVLGFIEDPATEVFVSTAVVWEIVIKNKKGHLPLPSPASSYIPSRMGLLGFYDLPITREHTLAVALLPDIHWDPFDRIMIAQAQVEGLTLVTSDSHILRYPVQSLHA